MTAALPSTKLHRPPVRPNWVLRDRLLEKLDSALAAGHPLILASAPAGWGKTTLISHWLAERAISGAWVSLDAADNNPAGFWGAAVHALRVAAGLGQALDDALASSQPPPAAVLLPRLVDEIAVYGAPLVLVLDDYHVIEAAPIHQAVASLLEYAPPLFHVVLTTRADPPLPLARLRARDRLTEIRAADLRFTGEEAAQFLDRRTRMRLEPADLQILLERTEGWAAGLQLAGLSFTNRADAGEAIRSFRGDHHFVLDYLVEEVLARQEPSVQRFLAYTSVLDRLCGPLCDALVQAGADASGLEPDTGNFPATGPGGLSPSGELLDRLHRNNLFLVPLDDRRYWYRYHHLFADLLRARLQALEPDIEPTLCRVAAGWCERNDLASEAIRYAFAAGDAALAAEMIERHGHARWSLGDVEFMRSVSKLPSEQLLARPALGVYQAWTLIIFGQMAQAGVLLQELARRAPGDDDPRAPGLRSFVDLLIAYVGEMTGSAIDAPLPDPRSLEFVPETQLGMRNSAEVVYATLLSMRGEYGMAEQLLLRTMRRDVEAGGTTAVPVVLARLTRIMSIQGRLCEAERLCREQIRYLEGHGAWRFYAAGYPQIALGEILREWNRLDEAEAEIRAGIKLNEPWEIPTATALGQLALARVQLAKGDCASAAGTVEQIDRLLASRTTGLDLASEFRLLRAELALAAGDLDEAGRILQPVVVPDGPGLRDERNAISRARFSLAGGRPEEAQALLEPLEAAAAEGGRYGRQAEIAMLLAEALWAMGKPGAALAALTRSLARAEPGGYLRLFLDEGPRLAGPLAALARTTSPFVDYARRVLAAFPAATRPAPAVVTQQAAGAAGAAHGLVEPLTPRESEVLALLCAGRSNQEIAERLVITVAAVKKHTGNIYGKLGVTSRTQAIVHARQLGLATGDA